MVNLPAKTTVRGVHPENRWYQAGKGRPSAPGLISPAGSPEKNRRVCALEGGRVSKPNGLWVRSPSHSLGVCVALWEARTHRRLYLGNIARAVRVARPGAQWGAPAPSSSRESPGINSPVRGEGGAYATSASWLRLFHCFSTRSRGAQTSGLASFIVVAAPPGRSEQNRSSPPPLTLNGESEGIFFFVIK